MPAARCRCSVQGYSPRAISSLPKAAQPANSPKYAPSPSTKWPPNSVLPRTSRLTWKATKRQPCAADRTPSRATRRRSSSSYTIKWWRLTAAIRTLPSTSCRVSDTRLFLLRALKWIAPQSSANPLPAWWRDAHSAPRRLVLQPVQHLPDHAQPQVRVIGGQVVTPQQAPDLFFRGFARTRRQIPAGMQSLD